VDSHGWLDGDKIQDHLRGGHVDQRGAPTGRISCGDKRAAGGGGVPWPGLCGLTIIAIREPPDEILILWARIRIEYEHLGKPSRHHQSRRTTQSGLEGARRGGGRGARGARGVERGRTAEGGRTSTRSRRCEQGAEQEGGSTRPSRYNLL